MKQHVVILPRHLKSSNESGAGSLANEIANILADNGAFIVFEYSQTGTMVRASDNTQRGVFIDYTDAVKLTVYASDVESEDIKKLMHKTLSIFPGKEIIYIDNELNVKVS